MKKQPDLDSWFRDNQDWVPYADLAVRPPLPEELMSWFPGQVSTEMLSRCMEMVNEGGGLVSRGALYVRVRREDAADDKWATMLALNAFPGIKTTDTFWAGRKQFNEVFGDKYADTVKKKLASQGVNLKAGDEYMPELARFQGDPEAVVPFGGARSYIKTLCEKRGWSCDGATTVGSREPEKDPHIPGKMDDRLIRQKGRLMVEKGQLKNRLSRGELRDAVQSRFGPTK